MTFNYAVIAFTFSLLSACAPITGNLATRAASAADPGVLVSDLSEPAELPMPKPGDRFVVTNTADRLADGSVTNCRLEGLPSDGSCDAWTQDTAGGPGLFAQTHRPGEALRLSMVVDVRPWTGALQPSIPDGTVEQVVLLGGEGEEGCGRLSEGGPAMRSWDEVSACPAVTDAAAFFATLGDPRPRQAIWSLTATPLPTPSD